MVLIHDNFTLDFIFFGLATNLSFLFVAFRVPHMRNITNFYLCNLALADLLYLVTDIVTSIKRYISFPVKFAVDSVAFCIVQYFVSNACFNASIHLVTLVTFERYLAICHPFKHHLVKGWKRTLKLTAVIWIISGIIGVTTLLTFQGWDHVCVKWPDNDKILKYSNVYKKCNLSTHGNLVVTLVSILWLTCWMVESVGNFAMYFQIIRHLHRRSTPGCDVSDSNAVYNTQSSRCYADHQRHGVFLLVFV